MSEPAPRRDYRQLFIAMNRAVAALGRGTDDESVLRESFEHATQGFAARKALLFRVESAAPPVLRNLLAVGLTPEQIRACQTGESAPGVSSSLIREALLEDRPLVRQDPRAHHDANRTGSYSEGDYSALCAPILDPYSGRPLAVVYFQTPEFPHQYGENDTIWLESYATGVGLAFGQTLRRRKREEEIAELLEATAVPDGAPDLIGDDPLTQDLRRALLRFHIPAAAATRPFPLLLLGEKGTGKELLAQFIHAYSDRRNGPFRSINCAELTEEMVAARFFGHRRGAFTGALQDEPGLFRSADKGVLFIDEIAHLTHRGQAALLGVLENHKVQGVGDTRQVPVDVQVILATNRDLDDPEVREKLLLEDFWDRIGIKTIRLPALRERLWDIVPLAEHFRTQHEKRLRKRTLGFTREVLRALTAYSWPGNVRELSRVADLLVTVARSGEAIDRKLVEQHYPRITSAEPSPRAAAGASLELSLREATHLYQRQLILARIDACGGDMSKARESLGLPWTTMKRFCDKLGIDAKAFRHKTEPAVAD